MPIENGAEESGVTGDSFAQCIADLTNEEVLYLGDPGVIDRILQVASTDMWVHLERGDADRAVDAHFRIAGMVAEILLNKVPGTAPVPGWNNPGSIDQYVLVACDEAEGDCPEAILASAVLQMFTEFLALTSRVEDSLGDLDAQSQVAAIYGKYRNLFMGIPATCFEGLDMKVTHALGD